MVSSEKMQFCTFGGPALWHGGDGDRVCHKLCKAIDDHWDWLDVICTQKVPDVSGR